MSKLKSEQMVVQSPMSYTGSAKRIWRMTDINPLVRWLFAIPAAVGFSAVAWTLVTGWYLLFGLFLAPYRLLRRGSRKRKRDEQRHREMLVNSGG